MCTGEAYQWLPPPQVHLAGGTDSKVYEPEDQRFESRRDGQPLFREIFASLGLFRYGLCPGNEQYLLATQKNRQRRS